MARCWLRTMSWAWDACRSRSRLSSTSRRTSRCRVDGRAPGTRRSAPSSAGVSGQPRDPSPTQKAQIRSSARRVLAGSSSAAASRMSARSHVGPEEDVAAWQAREVGVRERDGVAHAAGRHGRRDGEQVAMARTRSCFAVSACSNGGCGSGMAADEPVGRPPSRRRLAGLDLDHEQAVLRVDQDEVRLAVVGRAGGAGPGHEATLAQARALGQGGPDPLLGAALRLVAQQSVTRPRPVRPSRDGAPSGTIEAGGCGVPARRQA